MELTDIKQLLFLSENHGMSIVLEYKSDPDHYIIEFYDPNITTSHRCGVCLNQNAICDVSIDAFLDERRLENYFPKIKSGVFAIYNDISFPAQELNCRECEFHPNMKAADRLWFSMFLGLTAVKKILIKQS